MRCAIVRLGKRGATHGLVIATVRVHGEFGDPYDARVWAAAPGLMARIKLMFGNLTVHEREMP